MAKKKNNKIKDEEVAPKKKGGDSLEEEALGGEDLMIDPAIIEDTFIEEFSEYNDVDEF